jgi:hypothetical protein
VVAASLLIPAAAPAFAVDDVTPPVGTVAVVHDDRDNALVRLSVPATDASGVAIVEVSGDGVTWASYPYAAEVDWAVFDPAAGGDAAFGTRTVRVRWTDGVGNVSEPITTALYLGRNGAVELPMPPITGELFTIKPIYGPGEIPPTDDPCSWELAWGDDEALRHNKYNETWGSLFTSGRPDRGHCGPWTFTVPWVPVRQFEVFFNSPLMSVGDEDWDLRVKFYPTVGSTDRRIRSSNIPIVQVLPDKYSLVVGQKITYTAYPIGTSLRSNDTWIAYCPDFNCNGAGIAYKIQYGGSTFTLNPPWPGKWLIAWNGRHGPLDLNATYDPRVRKPDYYRPDTTPPLQRVSWISPGSQIPVALSWSGSDRGWGIARYKLQRSTDGGTWQTVSLPTPKTTSIVQWLTRGHRYQFRVRAVDKYGNVGYWDYGPTFKPKLVGDGGAAITYRGPWTATLDPTAIGGNLHHSDATGASAKLSFTGRDIAWVAEKGPGLGRARVYIDGSLRATVDLEAASEAPAKVVFRRHWSSAGSHTIKVVVEGTAGRPTVTVDAFVILR